uniref:Uncharacterized protein n=2 Tax=Triticinae TaxID=1648030 RepID=A0A452ZVT6_AEGTS
MRSLPIVVLSLLILVLAAHVSQADDKGSPSGNGKGSHEGDGDDHKSNGVGPVKKPKCHKPGRGPKNHDNDGRGPPEKDCDDEETT